MRLFVTEYQALRDGRCQHMQILVGGGSIDDSKINLFGDQIVDVGALIGESKSLLHLELSLENNYPVSNYLDELALLSRGMGDNSSIREILLVNFNKVYQSGGREFQSLAPFIQYNSNLEDITFNECDCTKTLTSKKRIFYLSNSLAKRTPLTDLDLCGSTINNRLLKTFIFSFKGHADSLPRALYLQQNSIGIRGYRCLGNILSSSECSIETLDLSYNLGLNKAVINIISKYMKNNKKLRNVYLDPVANGISKAEWDPLVHLLIGNGTPQSAYTANHSLKRIIKHVDYGLPKKIKRLLSMNSSSNKRQIACEKVIKFTLNKNNNSFYKDIPEAILINAPQFFKKAADALVINTEEEKKLCLSFFFELILQKPHICQNKQQATKEGEQRKRKTM